MTASDPAGTRAAAVAYTELGFAVLPFAWLEGEICACGCRSKWCPRRAKHPVTEHGRPGTGQRGSHARAQIEAWWETWPRANVGLDCGASRLVVLDIDPYKRGGESLEKLRGLVGGADLLTSTALTSRGGRHLYYRSGANTYATRRNWPLPGIDTIGQGLAVVAPPSVHALGDVYAWAPGLESMDDASTRAPSSTRSHHRQGARLALEDGRPSLLAAQFEPAPPTAQSLTTDASHPPSGSRTHA